MTLYRHFKGGFYAVLQDGITNSETKEEMVLYADQNGSMYVRPKKMFYGLVTVEGKEVPRFELVMKMDRLKELIGK